MNLKGQRFPRPKGPASLILDPMRDVIWNTLNCFWNPGIIVKYLASDGVSTLTKECDIIMSPLGWTATIDLKEIALGSGGTSSTQMFRVTALNGDYLTCRTWDGTTLGGTDIYVAKPWNFRTSLATEVIDGVTVTYTWTSDNVRSANDGTHTDTEKPLPRYISAGSAPYDEIYAVSVPKTGVATVDAQATAWLEVSPCRQWQAQ